MKKATRYLFLFLCWVFWASVFGQQVSTLPRSGKDYALFFAVNQYDKMRPLSNPIRDAKVIAGELEARFGFKTEIVENPSIEQIEQKLAFYKKQFASGRFASDGQLLLFFTGHGMVENKNGFFLARDSDPEKLPRTAWGYEYWRPFLNTIDCKHLLVSIDACYSGTFDPNWWSKSGFGRPDDRSEGEKLLARHEQYKTRMFFTSATEVQSPDDSQFVKKFLEGLRSGAGRDGILTSTELFSFLEQAYPQPYFGNFGDYDPGSSFLFVLQNPLENTSVSLEGTQAMEKDLKAWKAARAANTISDLQAYLQQFPKGEFRGMAIMKIQDLEREAANHREELAWEFAKEKNNREAYLDYQEEYPEGQYYKEASLWIQEAARLEAEKSRAVADAKRKAEQQAWEAAKEDDTKEAYLGYQQAYPEGIFFQEASEQLRKLERKDRWSSILFPDNPQSSDGDLNTSMPEGISTAPSTTNGGLGGRGVVLSHSPKDDSQLTGTVVVLVCIDRNGDVISADFTQRGSTTSSSHLIQLAVDSAKKWKFSPGAVDKQCGNITFNFKER